MANNTDVAIRKRQQIDSSKKTVFIFVAGAAFILGTALVVSVFLIQQILFHSKVFQAKQDTATILEKNVKVAKDLKDSLRVLETNEALSSVKIKPDNSALQSVLDALPSGPNADALGASLQQKFVGAVEGLVIEGLTVEEPDEESESSSHISFVLSVSGPADSLKALLARFEKSIRVIEVTAIEVQASDNKLVMNIQGRAQFEPSQTVKLETKVIKP